MEKWLFSLPVVWLAAVIFTATGLVTYAIHATVARLAVGQWTRVFKGVSPGMLPPLGIVFGLFVAFVASQVWADVERATAAVNREASALSTVVFLSASFPGRPEAELRSFIQQHVQQAAMQECRRLAALKEKDFAAIDAIVHDLVTQRRPADAMNVEVDQALDVFSTKHPRFPISCLTDNP